MSRWTCPDCQRQFGRTGQGHECAPAMTLEEYLDTSPPHERPVLDVVLPHLRSLDPDLHIEPVSVGIFVKLSSTFLQLRTMTRWTALSFFVDRRLDSARISRKPAEYNGRWHHVVNLKTPDDYDDVVRGWVEDAYELERSRATGTT